MRTANCVCVLALASCSGLASAGLVTSFGFTELSASFDIGTGEFMAEASSANGLSTTGDVTGYGAGVETVVFNPGFYTGGTDAYVLITMSIVNVVGNTAFAEGGRFLIRDADGDNLAGSFEGQWNLRFGFAFFDGEITSAQFNDAGDGIFEGPGGGSFDTPEGTLIGALSFLMMESTGSLFSDSFEARPASVDGMLVVPAPGALTLAGIGGLVLARRRRG
ncbi:MAG: hypothetical protein D6692_05705 [Planctomycetota bacterium]|nr:MAG: hypothetical protein D6692_05705 [Planctomycetota bacterium]